MRICIHSCKKLAKQKKTVKKKLTNKKPKKKNDVVCFG